MRKIKDIYSGFAVESAVLIKTTDRKTLNKLKRLVEPTKDLVSTRWTEISRHHSQVRHDLSIFFAA
jgi:hypothetical protein